MEWAEVDIETMAHEIRRSTTTIRNYLSGRTIPSHTVLVVWAMRTGVPLDWLEEDDRPPGRDISPRACNGSKPPRPSTAEFADAA